MRRLLAPLLALACGLVPGCRERGRPDPNVRMVVSHEVEGASAGNDPAPGVPTRLVIPPEVAAAYSGIRVAWRDAAGAKEGTIEVPLGESESIPGSSLEVRADVFLPAFTMASDMITSTGIEPENPAARVTVSEGGRELFAGWIFTRFPDVHPFRHERITIRLEGGIRRDGK